MGKHYIRRRAKLNGQEPESFTCTKCGKELLRKDLIKQHLKNEHH